MNLHMTRTLFWTLAGALLLAFAAAHLAGLDVAIQTALLAVFIVLLWATAIVPEFYAALLFFALVLVSGVASETAALAGFQSKAIWLVFAGIILGAAIQQQEIGKAAFDRLVGRITSYRALIWSLALGGLALSFVVPSAMGRVMLIAPLIAALCDRLALAPASPERTGVCLAAIAGAVFPAFTILPSNVPNVVMLGAMEASYGHGITYGDYFVLNFPVLGAGALLLLPALICRLFPGRIEGVPDASAAQPWTAGQMRLAVILLATLAFWASDALHGVPAAWSGLAAAVVCLAPRIGVLPPAMFKTLNFGSWFFVAGAIGLGAVVAESGLGAALWQIVAAAAPLGELNAALQYAVLVLTSMVLAAVATLPAGPSVFTPLAGTISKTLGWPVDAVVLAQVPSFLLFVFPYQAPPVLVGLTLLDVPFGRAVKLLGLYTLIGVLVLVPLHYLWGRLLGVFP